MNATATGTEWYCMLFGDSNIISSVGLSNLSSKYWPTFWQSPKPKVNISLLFTVPFWKIQYKLKLCQKKKKKNQSPINCSKLNKQAWRWAASLISEKHQAISHSLDICRITCSSFHTVFLLMSEQVFPPLPLYFLASKRIWGLTLCILLFIGDTFVHTAAQKLIREL